MKTYCDNLAINKLKSEEVVKLSLTWPTSLLAMNVGPLFEHFPKFDSNNKLYVQICEQLQKNNPPEVFIDFFDYTFVECLTHVKNIPQVDHAFLLEKIKELKDQPIAEPLEDCKHYLLDFPYEAMHDLTLYLAWDRVCINIKTLFEFDQDNPIVTENLKTFKYCLVESFQHITGQAKTLPSFYRLMDSLFIYYMRNDVMQTHTAKEWDILSKSFNILQPEDTYVDVPYIDIALSQIGQEEETYAIITGRDEESVLQTKKLGNCIIELIKKDEPSFLYFLEDSPIKYIANN